MPEIIEKKYLEDDWIVVETASRNSYIGKPTVTLGPEEDGPITLRPAFVYQFSVGPDEDNPSKLKTVRSIVPLEMNGSADKIPLTVQWTSLYRIGDLDEQDRVNYEEAAKICYQILDDIRGQRGGLTMPGQIPADLKKRLGKG